MPMELMDQGEIEEVRGEVLRIGQLLDWREYPLLPSGLWVIDGESAWRGFAEVDENSIWWQSLIKNAYRDGVGM